MIRVEKLSKRFGPKVVLNQVSMDFLPGEITFVLGKSGVGKSVLLKNIVRLLEPDSGEILVDTVSTHSLDDEGLILLRKKCGMVFQFPALLDSLNVYENVAFGLRSHRLCHSEEEVKERVVEKLRLVNLTENVLEKYPANLSFGEQKRVSIARTLAIDPQYLLFDEPTTSLDPVTTNALNQLIFDLSRKLQLTSIVVSHDLDCALKIADRVILLNEGKVVFNGTAKGFLECGVPLAKAFVAEMERERD